MGEVEDALRLKRTQARDESIADGIVNDARNYSGNVIDVPEGYDASADLESRLADDSDTPVAWSEPWESHSGWDRHVVVGEDGIDRVFVQNRDTGETLNVTDHPDHKPSKTELDQIDNSLTPEQLDDRANARPQSAESQDEEEMSVPEALEALRRKEEGPKKLSPGYAHVKVGERKTYTPEWMREGWGPEEPLGRPQDAPATEAGQMHIGAHPSQAQTHPAFEETVTRERYESEPEPEPLTEGQKRQHMRAALVGIGMEGPPGLGVEEVDSPLHLGLEPEDYDELMRRQRARAAAAQMSGGLESFRRYQEQLTDYANLPPFKAAEEQN